MKKNNFRSQGKSAPQGRGKKSSSQGRGGAAPRGGGGGGHRKDASEVMPREWRAIIGTHAIKEALQVRPHQVQVLWLRTGWSSSGDLREMEELARDNNIKIEVKPEGVLERFGPSQQGAAMFVDGAPTLDLAGLESFNKSIVLILDGIEDPHNLGAILRTSWLMGVHGAIIPEDRAVGLTPTVHKVACGGVEHVPVEETTNFANYAEELKKMGYWIFGLSPRGKRSIHELELPEKVVWAIGSEDKGMRVNTERLCDELVYIPQASNGASYNASVATAMALSETLRQHAPRTIHKKSRPDE